MKLVKLLGLATLIVACKPNAKHETKQEVVQEKATYVKDTTAIIDRILPAPMNGGFKMEGYWVWGSSVIKGEDGKYHMFASRWPKWAGFGAWKTNSEVVRAISDTPEGPYKFKEVVLKKRGKEYFDGLNTHNPRIIKWKDKYVLYYFGSTYDYPQPTEEHPEKPEDWWIRAWMNKRIGCAMSESLDGPWVRADKPVIEPRREGNHWDYSITSNPGPVVDPKTGEIYLMYKSSSKEKRNVLKLGMSKCDHPFGPFQRLSDEPVFSFNTPENPIADVEDPYLWWAGDRIEVIMKDRDGSICGEEGGGLHGWSKDGVNWHLYKDGTGKNMKSYSKKILWEDGTVKQHNNFERPFLLINEHGQPTHLFAATGTAEDSTKSWEFTRSWNMCIPLKHIK